MRDPLKYKHYKLFTTHHPLHSLITHYISYTAIHVHMTVLCHLHTEEINPYTESSLQVQGVYL